MPVSSRNPGCCSWKTSKASGDVVSVLPSPTSRYLRISWSYLQRPFLALFWHHWDITKSVDSGKSCEFSSAQLLEKQDRTSELGLGVCRELLCPGGSVLDPWFRCPGMVLAAPQSRRGASAAQRQSLGFWGASSKDSQPESCTWEQQECCFQETGGLPGTEPTTLALLLQV